MTSEKELEELLVRFENFQCQETFHDTSIYLVYMQAFNYYVATHENVQHDKAVSFANFVAGYLRAGIDSKQADFL
jgi:hypothetical protein